MIGKYSEYGIMIYQDHKIDYYQGQWHDYWIKEMIITDNERVILEKFVDLQIKK